MRNLVSTGKDLSKAVTANPIKIKTIDDLQRLGELLAKSGFFEDCKQAAQACVKILCGAELGFPAFSSMVGIHLIKGNPAIGANLIAAAVKISTRYDYRVLELSDRICKIALYDRQGAAVYTPNELGATVDEDGEVNTLPYPIFQSERTLQVASQDGNGRQWQSPFDAIRWAQKQPPHLSIDQIQAEFDSLPRTNGKKALAWVEKVNQLVLEQF